MQRSFTLSALRRLALLTAISGIASTASAAGFSSVEQDFAGIEVVSNKELSKIRGGFMTSSGMILDLGLSTQTIVNGTVVENTVLSPEALKNVDPSTLRTLVRVTENNTTTEKLQLNDIPEIVTVIQSEANNVKIDQITSLNIDVQNVDRFNLQTQTPGLNYSVVMSLR